MKTIITPQEAKTLGRPIGKVADDKILSFIIEIEQTMVRRMLGDELYIKILDKVNQENTEPEPPIDTEEPDVPDAQSEDVADDDFNILLNGGRYETECGEIKILNGLKVAEAYYVYAQNVRAGDYESTRYGMVVKDDMYSNGISAKERDQIANNATLIGDAYIKECLEFCRIKGILPKHRSQSLKITTGCIIRKIKK